MTLPNFTAEASLYPTRERYRANARNPETFGSVLSQQLCRRSGQSCGGIDLFCCPGLTCTAEPGGVGVCVRAPPPPPPPRTCEQKKAACTDSGGVVVDCHDFYPDGCATPPCQPCCFVCS
jgi:hypothetical protein